MVMQKDSIQNNKILFDFIVFWFVLICCVSGCLAKDNQSRNVEKLKNEGQKEFALYLVKEKFSAYDAEKIPLEKLELEKEPFFTLKDVISYDVDTHSIEVKDEIIQKVKFLKPSTHGRPFVISVSGERIYQGAFWNIASSFQYYGIAIMFDYLKQDNRKLRIQLGIPKEEYFKVLI